MLLGARSMTNSATHGLESNGQSNQATIGDYEETCQNGTKHCPGPDGDRLPCLECFFGARDVNAQEALR